jgi:hypothetical protein
MISLASFADFFGDLRGQELFTAKDAKKSAKETEIQYIK